MKRFLGFAAVAAMLVALPLSHLATAQRGGGAAKITICHIPDDSAEEPTLGGGPQGPEGIVIRIARRAWPAHEAHGDCILDGPPATVRPSSCRCYLGET